MNTFNTFNTFAKSPTQARVENALHAAACVAFEDHRGKRWERLYHRLQLEAVALQTAPSAQKAQTVLHLVAQLG